MLWVAFFGWMIAQGVYHGATLFKIVGSKNQRMWYMAALFLVTCYVLAKYRVLKGEGIRVLLSAEIVNISIFFALSLGNACRLLLMQGAEGIKNLGYFLGGRLSCFGNPNATGTVAATLIMISVWQLVINKEYEKFRWLSGGISVIGLTIGVVALSLSRSRGSILAAGAGVGVAAFLLVYKPKEKWRGFFSSLVVTIVVAGLSVGLLLAVKSVFGSVVKLCVSQNAGMRRAAQVEEELEAYSLTYALDTLTDRTNIWPATLKMLDEKPEKWIWGYDSHESDKLIYIYDAYEGRPEIMTPHAHSGYLQQLFLYGVPGASILVILLITWCKRCVCLGFDKNLVGGVKIPISLVAMGLVNEVVEWMLFPGAMLYPVSLFFFGAIGVISGQMSEKGQKKNHFRVIATVLAVCAVFAVAGGSLYAYKAGKERKESSVELPVLVQQNSEDYVRFNNYVSEEMMEASYWIGEGADRVIKDYSEIYRVNYENRRMISTEGATFSQKEVGDEFYAKVAKQLVKDVQFANVDPEKYVCKGKVTTKGFWDELEANADSEAIVSRISVVFGYSVSRDVLKRYPTDEKVYEASSNLYYDEMATSDLQPFMPLVVLHESLDGEWYYVLTYGYGGWTRKENVALCHDRDEWIERQEEEQFLVVTGRELRLPTDPYHEELSDMSVQMGTKLPIVKLSEVPESIHDRVSFGNYITKLPARGSDGYIEDVYVLVPANADVSLGYLPYTEEKVAGLAFKHLGAGYGWAGDHLSQDCSGLTREIFACFGYELPRSASAQSKLEYVTNLDVSKKTDEEKLEILKELPIGTLIYFPGHIMMYVGMSDGVPYCLSSVGDYSTVELGKGNIQQINTVVLTNMVDTTRARGDSWLAAATRFVAP